MALKPQGNNILAGTSLAIAQIQSPNYVPGVSGWCIFQNGDAEFNSGTFRGNIVGGALYIYNGTPGPGNAPIAWISEATTDPYGNTLTPASNVVIGAGQHGNPQVVLESSSGTGEIAFPLPGTWTNYPNILGSVSGSGGLLSINGPTDATVDDQAYMALGSAAAGFDGGSAGFMNYADANGGQNTIAYWGDFGMIVNVAANIFGVEPGTGGTATNPAVQESWHAPALANSWANTAGFAPFQYRIVASPPNSVELIGVISATAATSTTFFTLPAGYRPANAQGFAVGATGGVPAGSTPNVRCSTGGVLTLSNAAAVPAADSYFIHGFISLDA